MTVKRHAIIVPDRRGVTIESITSTSLEADGSLGEAVLIDETGAGRATLVSSDPPGGDMHPQLVGGDARGSGRVGVLTPGTLDSARWSFTKGGAWWSRTSPQVFNRPFVAMRHWTPDLDRNMGDVRDITTAGMAYVQRVRLAENGRTVLCAQGYGMEPRERELRIRGIAIQVDPNAGWPIVYQSSQDVGWWSREDLWTLCDFDIAGDRETGEWVFVGAYNRGASGRRLLVARSRDGGEWTTVGEFSVGYEPEMIPTGDISIPGGDNSLLTACAVECGPSRSLSIIVSTRQGVYGLYSRDAGASVQVSGEISSQNSDIAEIDICRLRDGTLWAAFAFGWVNEGVLNSNIYSLYSRSGEGWVLGDAVGFSQWEAPKAWSISVVQRPDGHGQMYTAGRSWLSGFDVKRSIVSTRAFVDADVSGDTAFEAINLGNANPGGKVLQIQPVFGCDSESTWPKGAPDSVDGYHVGPVEIASVEHDGRVYVAVGTNVEYDDGVRANDGGATVIYETNRWSPVASARGLTWRDDWFLGVDSTHGRGYHIHYSPAAEPESLTYGWVRTIGVDGLVTLGADLSIKGPVYYSRASIPNFNGGDADNSSAYQSERSFAFEAELRVIAGGSKNFDHIVIDVQMVDDSGFTSLLKVRFEREDLTAVNIRCVHADGSNDITIPATEDDWIAVWGGHEEKGGHYSVYLQVNDGEAIEALQVSSVISPGGTPLGDERIRWGHVSAAAASQSAWRLFQIQRATGSSTDARGGRLPIFRLLTDDDFDSTFGGVIPQLADDTVTGVSEQIRADSGVFNNDMPCRTRTWGINCDDVISAAWRGIATSTGSWSWLCERESGVEAAVGSPARPARYDAGRSWETGAGELHGDRALTLDVDGVHFDAIAIFGRNWPACTIEAYHPDLAAWVSLDVGPGEGWLDGELRDSSLWRAAGGDGFRGEATADGFDIVHPDNELLTPLPLGAFEEDVDRGIRYYVTGLCPMTTADRLHVWSIRTNTTRSILTNTSPLDLCPFWNIGATWGSLLDVRQAVAVYSDRFALDLSPIVQPDVSGQVYLGKPSKLRITIHAHARGDLDAVKTGTILLGQLFDLTRPGFGSNVDEDWQTGAVHTVGARGIAHAERDRPMLRSWSVGCQYIPELLRVSYIDGQHRDPAERIDALVSLLRRAAGREVAWVPDADLLTPNPLANPIGSGNITDILAGGQTVAAWRELSLARVGPAIDVGTSTMQGIPDENGDCRALAINTVNLKLEEI